MILIDALYVNTGGGKVLLDYLIEKLEETNIEVFYLLDMRVKKNHKRIKSENELSYMDSSLFNRYNFYKTNNNKFDVIFCLGNIPPLVRTNCKVYTYFHNTIYLNVPYEFSKWEKLLFTLKKFFINILKENTNEWWVQTNIVKNRFSEKFNVIEKKIKVIPFYPPFLNKITNVVRKKHTYVYISNAPSNKNHLRLIEAFCIYFNTHKKGELILTVDSYYHEVFNFINEKIKQGYPIVNLGYIGRKELNMLYCSVEYLIFPSLEESFGLGIIEAISNGCKIIGADLPYIYEICKPTLVFDPRDVNSIIDAFEKSNIENLEQSVCIVTDKINILLEKLTQ